MIGKPKYDYGDIVSFTITNYNGKDITCEGVIEIIDRYGTFEQKEEVSYDIMVHNFANSGEKMFVKHITEPHLTLVKKGNTDNCELR